MSLGFQMIVNSGLVAFVQRNDVAGATKQFSAILTQSDHTISSTEISIV